MTPSNFLLLDVHRSGWDAYNIARTHFGKVESTSITITRTLLRLQSSAKALHLKPAKSFCPTPSVMECVRHPSRRPVP